MFCVAHIHFNFGRGDRDICTIDDLQITRGWEIIGSDIRQHWLHPCTDYASLFWCYKAWKYVTRKQYTQYKVEWTCFATHWRKSQLDPLAVCDWTAPPGQRIGTWTLLSDLTLFTSLMRLLCLFSKCLNSDLLHLKKESAPHPGNWNETFPFSA